MSVPAALAAASVRSADLGPRAAVHLLNRIAYGPRPGDVARVLSQGLERYVEDQLDAPSDPEIESRLRGLTTLGYSTAQVVALYNQDNRNLGPILDEFYTAKVIRSVHAQDQLRELLVDFWFNHFNVYINDGFARYATMSYERDALRPHVLGRFRDLLAATAEHPAMVYYLDNYLSTVSRYDARTGALIQGLNENYGRELLELHTVGVDAGYSQEDVFEAARAFTGWTIDFRTSAFVYRSANHDRGAKKVFGLDLPAGGEKSDGDRVIEHLSRHPATARFVSFKLARRFVSDDPPAGLVERAADTFLATDGDLREVMRTLLFSREFWAEAFGAGKPKTPLEYVASALRAVGAQVTHARGVTPALALMGMPSYQCLPPTGWSSRGADWLNPTAQLARMNFGLDLAAGAVAGVTLDARAAARAYGAGAEDAKSIAAGMSYHVFGRGLSAKTMDAAVRVSPSASPSVAAKVVGLLLAAPEMQVR